MRKAHSKQKPVYLLLLLLLVCKSVPAAGGGPDKEHTITIVDENGSPMPGVTVFTSDQDCLAVSGMDGKVVLRGLSRRDTVQFKYVGYRLLRMSYTQLQRKNGKVILLPDPELLQTVTVVGRRDDKAYEIPYQIERIGREDIALTNAQTAADALSDHAGVFVQKSQMGGGSPVLRGFEANRVLLVLDGVRLNNAIFRNGHLQNAITIDNAMLEQVEVIYGPGSLIYGSDALGGVVHYRSRDPLLFFGASGDGPEYRLEGNFYSRYSSANREKTIHADLNYGRRQWGFLTSLSYSGFGDLRAGSRRTSEFPEFGKRPFYIERIDGEDRTLANEDPDRQLFTNYTQFDLLQKVRFQASEKLYFIANIQLSTSSDIPRYDQLTRTSGDPRDLRFAEWYYGPQTRLMTSLKARLLNATPLFDQATLIGAWQFLEEDRFERRTGNDWRESSLVDVQVYSLTADFDKNLDKTDCHLLSYGIDLAHNQVGSVSFLDNIRNGERDYAVNARYPDAGSRMSSFGTYANYRWRSLDSSIVFNGGLRYSLNSLFARFSDSSPIQWPRFYTEGISSANGSLTWAAGLTYHSPGKWQVRLLTATGFRSPNIDDFAKFREKDGFVSVPNPRLNPEKALTVEGTLAKEFGELNRVGDRLSGYRLKLSATAFYTRLTDAIVREDFYLPDGGEFFLSMGDTLFVQANVNAEGARIYGVSGNLLLHLGDSWELRSGINYTYGRRTYSEVDESGAVRFKMQVPQDHIPPVYGQSSLAFTAGRFRIQGVIRYNGAKKVEDYAVTAVERAPDGQLIFDREGTADNIEESPADPLTGEYAGVYAWTTYNLYASFRLSQMWGVNAGLENITDVHYRTFASGLSAPGRNFIFALRGRF